MNRRLASRERANSRGDATRLDLLLTAEQLFDSLAVATNFSEEPNNPNGAFNPFGGPGGARVETEPVDHAHAYCEQCGKVVNLPPPPPGATRGADFHPRVENDVIFGLCHECFEARPEVDQAT